MFGLILKKFAGKFGVFTACLVFSVITLPGYWVLFFIQDLFPLKRPSNWNEFRINHCVAFFSILQNTKSQS